MASLLGPQKPLFPVQDQIRLWELVGNHIKTQEGIMPGDIRESFLILNFLPRVASGFLYTAPQADYEYVLNYAR